MTLPHFYRHIQGWASFLELYEEQVELAPKTGALFVEIGAWKGRSTAFMATQIANSKKNIRFFTVDHFLGSAEHIKRGEPEVVEGTLYETFLRNIAPVRKFVDILCESSIQAAQRFPDKSIDFLLLDGSHDYESVLADLRAWWPKMKPGVIMAGDDYRKPGVRQAVTEFFADKSIKVTQFSGSPTPEKPYKKCWKVRVP